jgi:hypothetical protein
MYENKIAQCNSAQPAEGPNDFFPHGFGRFYERKHTDIFYAMGKRVHKFNPPVVR